MYFDEEEYERRNRDSKKSFPILQTLIGASVIVFLLVFVVYLTNGDKKPAKKVPTPVKVEKQAKEQTKEQDDDDIAVAEGPKKRAQDLNFWNMYPAEEEKKDTLKEEAKVSVPKKQEETENEEEDPAKDGKHVQVTMDDGTTEWLAINKSLPANTCEDTNFQKEAGVMKYYNGGRCTSYAGVSLDKYTGEVDFAALKNAGISFVMLRAGARGYDSGLLQTDENFENYLKAAEEAGMNVGVYFSSQAISAQEAAEEADYVLKLIENHKVSYPVAVEMENIRNDHARTEGMSKNDRTTILRTFMEGVAGSGYTPMLMGDKDFLITKLDLAALSGFGTWLEKNGDLPEYPYKFGIWQYADNGQIKGINSEVKLNISLVDYSAR